MFERLARLGNIVPENDRFNVMLSVYAFEAFQVPRQAVELGGREMLFNHVSASFSICSNVDGCESPTRVATNGDPQELCDKFVETLLLHAEISSRILREKYASAFQFLEREKEKLTAKEKATRRSKRLIFLRLGGNVSLKRA